jgi:hypothetical protein
VARLSWARDRKQREALLSGGFVIVDRTVCSVAEGLARRLQETI